MPTVNELALDEQTVVGTYDEDIKDNTAAIKTAVQLLDNCISGSKALVTEDNSGSIKTAVEGINTKITACDTGNVVVSNKELDHIGIDFTSTSGQSIIAAPGVGYRIRLVSLDITAESSIELAVRSGATTIRTFLLTAMVLASPIPMNLGENEALVLQTTAAVRTTGGVSYYTESV